MAVLIAYTAGLWAYCILQILMRAFYSLQDTMTPMKVSLLRMGVNVTLNLTLVWSLWEAGIALATAITASLNVFLMMYLVRARMGRIGARSVLISALRVCGVTAMACAGALFALHFMPPGAGNMSRLVRVMVPMTCAGFIFLGACAAMRLPEWRELVEAFARRRRARTAPQATGN
jgi:putative peptidoglycan lipid II flippase